MYLLSGDETFWVELKEKALKPFFALEVEEFFDDV